MRILNLGISHHTADVALRERAAFGSDAVAGALGAFREEFPHVEAALLSTCNRTQWTIARPSHAPPDAETLIGWWAARVGVPAEELAPTVTTELQGEAVLRVFRVTAGLDAQVVGEPEIHHQVKRAYDAAVQARTVGPVLHHVFQQALAAAGAARHETGLSRAGASVPSAALALIQKQTADLAEPNVVCIGAGELAQATLRGLVRTGIHRLTLVNRTPERADALAASLEMPEEQRDVVTLDEMPRALRVADVLITAAATDHPIIDAGTLAFARNGSQRPMLVLDLAVPRNVAGDLRGLPGVRLIDLDELAATIENDPIRSAAIARCEERLAADAAACLTRVRNREIGQLIRQLRVRMHDIADAERDRSQRKLAALSTDAEQSDRLEQLIEEHGRRLINKVLHLPLQQLDARRDDVALGFYAAALRRLFDLHELPRPHEKDQANAEKQNPGDDAS
ncbi:MAG: glutamyl-tRNA reductase [Planctomycetota bacterium]